MVIVFVAPMRRGGDVAKVVKASIADIPVTMATAAIPAIA